MTLNAAGIEVPQGSDAFDPDGDMREMGTSLQGRVIIPVANTTERDALGALVSSRPLYVSRADAASGFQMEVATSASNWAPVASGLLQPYGGDGLHMRVTSGSPSTNSNGDASIPIPGGGFPSALVMAFLQYTAPNAAGGFGAVTTRWMPDLSSRTSVAFRLYGATGAPVASASVQILVLAFGR